MKTKRKPVIWVVRSWKDPDFRVLHAEIKVSSTSRDKVRKFLNDMSDGMKDLYGWSFVEERWITIGRPRDGMRGNR